MERALKQRRRPPAAAQMCSLSSPDDARRPESVGTVQEGHSGEVVGIVLLSVETSTRRRLLLLVQQGPQAVVLCGLVVAVTQP